MISKMNLRGLHIKFHMALSLELYETQQTHLHLLASDQNWGDSDVDGRIILRWIFRKWEGVVGTGWSWLRIGTGGGHL
jgi:hypothetical protein